MSVDHGPRQVVAENAIPGLRARYAKHTDAGEWAPLLPEDTAVESGSFEPLEGREEVL